MGAAHPLQYFSGCARTRRTCTNEAPALHLSFMVKLGLSWSWILPVIFLKFYTNASLEHLPLGCIQVGLCHCNAMSSLSKSRIMSNYTFKLFSLTDCDLMQNHFSHFLHITSIWQINRIWTKNYSLSRPWHTSKQWEDLCNLMTVIWWCYL